MKFKSTQHGGITVVALEGNLMGGPDASSLNGRLHELVAAGKKYVVIDLKEVEFVNSSGLGLLIGAITTMKNAGGALKFANVSEKIAGLITISKLGGLFNLYPSVEEAVASMK
jgi:anti-sigma B factor antagonist